MTTSLDFPFILWTSSRGRGRTGRWRHSRSLSSLAFPTPHRAIATYTALHFVAKPDRWASSPALYSGDVINHSELTELHDESDFEKLASSNDDLLSICGFGSLLSERSARSTFPDPVNQLQSRKIERISYRVFAHVTPVFFERGIAKPETMEISGLSVEPCEGESLIVTVFEIHRSEVFPETLDGTPFTSPAVLCARYSDEEFLQIRCKGSKEMFFEQYGRYNIHKIWRDDVFPCRVYLRHCCKTLCSLLAAKSLSDAAYNDFLDHTFLADRKTTIREYLATTGSGIMEEEPPESLKARYGG
uniref:Uncharacterized protein n=1 Tax=Vitis vinifera TaxID=29760 RepID=A5AH30_VITVI|nr:hypothetical protein VITISV_016051 [Vitis vinifera]